MNVFEDGDRIVIPCMYGRQSDWVANVIAGGGCSLVRRGATSTWTAPEVIGRDAATAIPPPVRLVLSGLSVEDVMRLSPGSRTEN